MAKFENQETGEVVPRLFREIVSSPQGDAMLQVLAELLAHQAAENPRAANPQKIDEIIQENPDVYRQFCDFVRDLFDRENHFAIFKNASLRRMMSRAESSQGGARAGAAGRVSPASPLRSVSRADPGAAAPAAPRFLRARSLCAAA